MTKALGFLTGVWLTVAVFLLLLNWWQLQQSDDASPAAVASNLQPANAASHVDGEGSTDIGRRPADKKVAAKTIVSANSATSIGDGIKVTTVQTDTQIPPLLPSVKDEVDRQNIGATQPFVDQTATAETQTIEATAESRNDPAPDQDRHQDTGNSDATYSHIFWSPFRSEWAAKGFAGRLTNATQITIDVIEVGSGKYRATFDYQTENQRLEHIERIEAITGLQLE